MADRTPARRRDSIPCGEIERMYHRERLPYSEIARRLGVGASTVKRRAEECGIGGRARGAKTARQASMMAGFDRDKMYQLYEVQKKTEYEIAPIVGHDPRTVRGWLERSGFKLRPLLNPPGRDISEEALKRMYVMEKMDVPQIASELGCPQSRVRRLMKKYGIVTRLRQLDVTLSEEVLRERRGRGVSVPQIAKEFGCTHSAVYGRLKRYGLNLNQDEHCKDYSRWCKNNGRARKIEMERILGECCHICKRRRGARRSGAGGDRGGGRDTASSLQIHHMWYEPDDVINANHVKRPLEYHVRLYPLVAADPGRFLLLCGGCHRIMGSMGGMLEESPGSMSRLVGLVEEMDRMRAEHPLTHDELVRDVEFVEEENRYVERGPG